jgi:hypothetical protein
MSQPSKSSKTHDLARLRKDSVTGSSQSQQFINFAREIPEPENPLGMAVADGMAPVHSFEGSDVWMQSLPADNIEPCSCSAFARSVHYVENKGIKCRSFYST